MWVECDTEEEAVGVLDGVELVLNRLMERGGRVLALGDLDGQEVGVSLIVGGIQSEHGILLAWRECEVGVRELDRSHTEFEDVL